MYLSIQEIRVRQEPILASMRLLMNTKALASRPGTRQWRFFQDAVLRLFDGCANPELDLLSPVRAAQLKFEVEDSLRRYYLRPGPIVDFVFSLVHFSKIADFLTNAGPNYPRLAGYCVLVRDLRNDWNSVECNRVDLKNYLERVVIEAVDAEFKAYQALPEIDPLSLSTWFYPDSPAIKEILNLLQRHQIKRWIISNALNPSTKRVMKVKVNKIGQEEAMVSTMEYWYLRWWAVDQASYVYPYRETNRQVYFLKKDGGQWKVFENLRPAPRTSAPHRRLQRRTHS